MAAKAAFLVVMLTMLLGGCGLFPAKPPETAPVPAAMPLTSDNVGMLRTAVAAAKIKAARPEGRDAYVRYARQVYAASVNSPWSATATTETALASAKAGGDPAREYLTIMVYDLQLQAAMEGASLSAEDWRAVYVGSGIMTDAVFTGYVAMSRGGKVLP
jgi:hypothetical protein